MTALARLYRALNAGRCVKPGDPHRYASDQYWPGNCWCGQPKNDPAHKSRNGVPL